MYDELLTKAVESVDAITDPKAKIDAIVSLLPFAESVKPVKKAKASAKTVKADKPAEETAKPVQAAPEPVKMETEVQDAITKVVEEKIIVPAPKPDETPAETEARHTAFIKLYGDMKLGEVFKNQELMNLLAPEFSSVGAFRELLVSSLGELVDEETIEHVFHFYVSEADETVKEYQDISMTKFLTVYLDHQSVLTSIYSADLETIDTAIRKINNSTEEGIQLGFINIDNAPAVASVIEALTHKKSA